MEAYQTSGSSPGPDRASLALRRVLFLFQGEHRYTSIRVVNPDELYPLPSRFVLVQRGGVYWLTDTSADTPYRAKDGGQP
jgi:hypothetical protein